MSPARQPRTAAASAEPGETAPMRTPEQELRIARALGDHFEMVWRSLRRFGVSESLADDAAQQVFVAFAQRIDVVEQGREPPYLIGIAARVAVNFRRQRALARRAGRADRRESEQRAGSGNFAARAAAASAAGRSTIDPARSAAPSVRALRA